MCLIVPADIFLKSMYSTFAQFSFPRASWRCFDDLCSCVLMSPMSFMKPRCVYLSLAFLALFCVALSLREVVAPVPEIQDELNQKE